jgi:hypothetical protein
MLTKVHVCFANSFDEAGLKIFMFENWAGVKG